jgi:hypothetical protein
MATKPVPEQSCTWAQTRAFRLARMHLSEPLGSRSMRRVAADLGGVQAQVHSAAVLQLAARMTSLSDGAVERALLQSKTLVKTWMMRGTIHYLDPGDLAVWASASATRRTWNKPYWQKYFKITEKDVHKAIEIIPEALDGRCLTREEIADEVHRLTNNAAVDKLMREGWGSILKIVAAEGLLCFGPPKGRNVTFVRPDQWLKREAKAPDTDKAIELVCERYLASHGPATREEFARWWGFAPPDATKVLDRLGDRVVLVDREGDRAYILRKDMKALDGSVEDDVVRALPMFDAYTLAGLPSDQIVPKAHKAKVYRKGAWVSQVIARGGQVVGVWTHDSTNRGTKVVASLFEPKTVSKDSLQQALTPFMHHIGELSSLELRS